MVNLLANGTVECKGTYTEQVYHLDKNLKCVIMVLFTMVMILTCLINSTIIYFLAKMKDLQNPSMRLILFLSISDLSLGLLGEPLLVAVLAGNFNCIFHEIVEFLTVSSAHMSAYITGCIGYDRYFRLLYLNEYSNKIQIWKVNVAMTVAFLIAIFHGLAQNVGIIYEFYEEVTTAGIVIDFLMFMFMVVPYVLAIRSVRQHRAIATNRELLKEVDQSVLTIASRIMITITILYIPYITFTIMRKYLPETSPIRNNQIYLFALSISYVMGLSNSFLNGIIFLIVCSKCRFTLIKMLRRRRDSAQSWFSAKITMTTSIQ